MQRLIVTSQVSPIVEVTPYLHERDPENRLWRAGRVFAARRTARQCARRDGLLNDKIRRPTSARIIPRIVGKNWLSPASRRRPTLRARSRPYRLSITLVSAPRAAALATFDAPDREQCTVRRALTNTPLQALILLDDPT